MICNQKLEFAWIGKDTRPGLQPRVLLENSARIHHATRRVTKNDIFDNRLALNTLNQGFDPRREAPQPSHQS